MYIREDSTIASAMELNQRSGLNLSHFAANIRELKGIVDDSKLKLNVSVFLLVSHISKCNTGDTLTLDGWCASAPPNAQPITLWRLTFEKAGLVSPSKYEVVAGVI